MTITEANAALQPFAVYIHRITTWQGHPSVVVRSIHGDTEFDFPSIEAAVSCYVGYAARAY